MKKRICILFLLSVFSIGLLSAKVSLVFDVGPLFTHFDHLSGSNYSWSTNVGGLNFVLRGEFAKNFGVYGMGNFAFGSRLSQTHGNSTHTWSADLTYAIDSQFGFFYAFKPIKDLEIMLGFGVGIGGSGYRTSGKSRKYLAHYTNIGGGFNVDVSYMFTKMIGVYGGLSDTMYAPVAQNTKLTVGDHTWEESYSGSKAGRFANAFSLKAGVQLKF